jgi:hypothetical protein
MAKSSLFLGQQFWAKLEKGGTIKGEGDEEIYLDEEVLGEDFFN